MVEAGVAPEASLIAASVVQDLATPRWLQEVGAFVCGYLASDGGTEVAYLYGPNVTTIPAAIFLEQHYDTTVKVFIAYLLFVGLAGWVTWQWVRDLRGAGPLPRLVQGLDRYALALLLGGALGASLFGLARLEAFFNDAYPTTADLIVGLLFVFLPAYGGVGFFLLWARRKR